MSPPRRALGLLEIHLALEKCIKGENAPYLLNLGDQMLLGARELH